MFGLLRRPRHERAGFSLYTRAVAAARAPAWYADLAVPDTLDGRFDMIALFVSLAIRRLRRLPPPGPDLAQAVFDAMFLDMDRSLRELGVGDLSIARKVKQMWEAFHGRALVYETALDADDGAALAAALARNVWRGTPPPSAAERLAEAARREMAHLESQTLADLAAGKIAFLPAATALA